MSEAAPLPLVEVLVRQGEAWKRGDRLSVEQILRQYPHLADDEESVLDLIYNETLLRESHGPPASLEEFVQRFPHLERALRLQFEVEQALGSAELSGVGSVLGSTVQLSLPAGAPGPLPGLEGCDVVDELGRGAMGVVYRAWQRAARRVVAIKLLSSDMPAARIETEVQAAARLSHPNIVQVFEVRQQQGRTALVLEYVEGGNLAQKLSGRPQAARDSARLVETLAWAMAYAHGRGVIHRDLKPSNVLLAGAEQAPLHQCVPKISDFGLAKLAEGGASLTRTTDILGTPSYMAPEQTGGAREAVGPAADIYALGAILYECLTGRPPFLGQGVLDTLEQVRNQDPVPPSRLQPRTPRDVEIICLKCLHKVPARRYASARELAEDLRRFQDGEPIRARPVGLGERLWKWARRRPAAAALVLVCFLAGVVLLWGGMWVNHVLRQQRDVARRQAGELDDRLRQMRRLLYTAQLLRVASVWENDPTQGLRMLEDPEACPPDLRCFSWGVLYGQCKRYRTALGPHPAPVTALAHHPQESLLASGCRNGEIRLWDGSRSTLRLLLRGHSGPVTSLAFAPSGTLLASAGQDGMVRLWEVPSGTPRGSLKMPRGRIAGLAFHPDSRTLAVNAGTRGRAGSLTLWDSQQLRLRRTLRDETDPVSGVAISPDGHTVACGGRDHAVRLWDTRTGVARRPLRGHTAPVSRLTFAPSGTLLASGALDGTVRLWDMERGTEVEHLEVETGPVTGLAFHPAGQTLAVAGSGAGGAGDEAVADVQLWDILGRRGSDPLRAHTGVSALAFAPDGRTLATAGTDGTLKLWDHPGRRTRVVLRGHPGQPGSLSLSANGRALAWIASADLPSSQHELLVHDLATGTFRGVLRQQARGVRCLALSPDGNTLATAAGPDNEPAELLLWDVTSGRLNQALSSPGSGITLLAYSPDGQHLASAGRDGWLRLWDAHTGKLRWQQRSLAGAAQALSFSGDGTALAVAWGAPGKAGQIAIWHAEDGKERGRLSLGQTPSCLALDHDGKLAAFAEGGDLVRLVQVDDGAEHASLAMGMKGVAQVAFSADGLTLAVAGTAQGVKLWDVPTLQQRASLPHHRGGACFVAFAADGQLLVTASLTQMAHVWHRGGPGR